MQGTDAITTNKLPPTSYLSVRPSENTALSHYRTTTSDSAMYAKLKGFTLIELLVVIAILGIMILLALPDMSRWIASRRAASHAEQIANLLRFARSEAVRLNKPVYICPVKIRQDGRASGNCSSEHAGSGLLAFADNNTLPGNPLRYDNDTLDLAVRTIILNGSDAALVSHTFQHIPFGSNSAQNRLFWVYLPNGTFGHGNSLGTAGSYNDFSISDGTIKISLTDTAAKNEAEQKARASIVLIDSSGRIEVCSKTDDRSLCQYSASGQ